MSIIQRVKSWFGSSSFSMWNNSVSPWGRNQLIDQFKGYVYTVTTAIASEVGRAEFEIKNQAGRVQENHGLIRLLNNPNSGVSRFSFLEMSDIHLSLVGEFFWYMVVLERSRVPVQLYLLPPDRMEVIKGDDAFGSVIGYKMRKEDGGELFFDADEIFHVKLPNPKNPYRGMSTLEAAALYVQTEQVTTEWSLNSIYNGGTPSGVLTIDGVSNQNDFEQFKRRFRDEYAGAKNASKVLIIQNAAAKYQALGMSLDAKMIDTLKKMSRDDIMAMWRVHKNMIGISEDVSLNNAKEGRVAFMQNVIEPRIWRLNDALDSFLLDRWGKGYWLDFKSPIPEDYEEKLNRYERGHNKWLTTNEIRQQEGLQPIKGGDTIYRPMNEVPVMESSTKSKKLILKDVEKITREQKNEIFRSAQFQHQAMWEKKYKQGLVRIFNEQKEEVLHNNKSKGRKKEMPGWSFDRERSIARYQGILVPLTRSLMQEQGKAALEFAGSNDPFALTDNILQFIDERVKRFARDVNSDIQDKITETISEGMRLGESNNKLRKRVESLYGDITTTRAELIARTETIAASSEATLEAYRQTGFVRAQEWIAEPTACQFCKTMDKKVIGLDSHFLASGESLIGEDDTTMSANFGDVDHPPLHPNCMCSIAPVNEFSTVRSAKVDSMKQKYEEMDKRTKEAKELLNAIQEERKKLDMEKKQLKDDRTQLDMEVDALYDMVNKE
jgi:HK97 family phage portal protein